MALEMFGLRIVHPVQIVANVQSDIVRLMNLQEQRLSNNAERWELPNLILEPIAQGDAKAHGFITQIMGDPRRIYSVDAPQFYNDSGTSQPSADTTAALTGAETTVAISFGSSASDNLDADDVNGIARRFFTFGNHDKLYLLANLGVAAGARAGTMTFTPNAQHEVPSGTSVNFATPKIKVALAQGLPPSVRTQENGFWNLSLDLVEQWLE